MFLKIVAFVALLYFVVRATGALLRAIVRGGIPSRLDDDRSGYMGHDHRMGGTNRNATRRRKREDVEDAKYVDIA